MCDARWQQTPPHRQEEDTTKDDLSRRSINKRRSESYKCGRCGKPKKGHICMASNPDNVAESLADSLVSNTFKPPAEALLLGDSPIMPFSGFDGLDLDALRLL